MICSRSEAASSRLSKMKRCGRDQRGGAEIIITAPERWAGCGASRAQNTFGRFVEAGALFGRLKSLFSIGRKRGFVDEIRQNLFIVIKERFHIHDQILDNFQSKQRLDGDLVADIAHQRFARQHVATIDAHRIRTAHAVRTRTPERQRAIVMTFDQFEQIQNALGLFDIEIVCLVMPLLIYFRDCNGKLLVLPAWQPLLINSLFGLIFRNDDRLISDLDLAVLLPSQGMLQPVLVIAVRVIFARMPATRLRAVQRADSLSAQPHQACCPIPRR